jgi:coproporphyrinogen III oxidase-like Fe-S oxidoreductase
MMGLRLVEGIDLRNWRDKFGVEIDAILPADKLRKLEAEAYIIKTAATLRATPQGLQRLNALLLYLLP